MENPEIKTSKEANQTTAGSPAPRSKENSKAVLQTIKLLRDLRVVACRALDDQVQIDDEVYYSVMGFDNAWYKDKDLQPGDFVALDEDFHTIHILRMTTYATVGSEERSMTKYFFLLVKKMDGVLPRKKDMILTIFGYLLMVIMASVVIIYLILRFFT